MSAGSGPTAKIRIGRASYDSAHIISSRRMSWFRDYPMPQDYPDYPSRRQIHAYFAAYADNYGLRRHIHFQSRVEKAERMENGRLAADDRGRRGNA